VSNLTTNNLPNKENGAAVGAAVGAFVGRAAAPAPAGAAVRGQMTLTDVAQLSQAGTDPDIIIQQIEATGSLFHLTTDDIVYLQDQGVDGRVIRVMQQRRTRTSAVEAPAPGVRVP
jgi:hypothetical protein